MAETEPKIAKQTAKAPVAKNNCSALPFAAAVASGFISLIEVDFMFVHSCALENGQGHKGNAASRG